MESRSLLKVENLVRIIVGGILWAISALLTASLFLSLAGNNLVQKAIMVLLAFALEGAKIVTWRMGKGARFLSIILISLSIFASFGAALVTVENANLQSNSASLNEIRNSVSYGALSTELKSIDSEISTILTRIGNLPPDFTTATNQLTTALKDLRNRKEKVLQSISSLESSTVEMGDTSNMFVLIGSTIGVRPQTIMLVLLIILAITIETGALILTSTRKPAIESEKSPSKETTAVVVGDVLSTSYQAPTVKQVDAKEFLKAATENSDLPYLHGRDKVCAKLGIGSYAGKKLVGDLLMMRVIQVDGKRLRLIGSLEEAQSSIITKQETGKHNRDKQGQVERSQQSIHALTT